MSDDSISSAQLYASGALGNNSDSVRTGEGVMSSGGGGGMMPFGDKGFEFGHSGIGSVFGTLSKSFDDAFEWMKSGSSALGSSISDVAGRIGNYLGAQEAGGDNLRLDGVGPGEINNHGIGVSGDAQFKHVSFRGSDGGQSAG